MKLGIVGLPNVGKSTLFNALTEARAEVANYPFCTIDPNVGVVEVPDKRLTMLAQMHNSERIVPAIIEFVDIAGLVAGASKGEGLGNKFLSHIREVDAVVHVVRCFDNPDITHVSGSVDPLRDIEVINLELIYSDIEVMERRIDKIKKQLKGDKSLEPELSACEELLAHLNGGRSARSYLCDEKESDIINAIPLLSNKKVIYVANVNEADIPSDGEQNKYRKELKEFAEKENSAVITICAGIEAELMTLTPDERIEFMREIGITESGLDRLIHAGYEILGLISFLTAGPKESRAWTIQRGSKAPQAAGKIHTDFERGFIRAETVHYDDLITFGSYNAAKEKGLVRSEGKDYEIKDGDVVLFRFNV